MKGRLTAIVVASSMLAGCITGSVQRRAEAPERLTPCDILVEDLISIARGWSGSRGTYRKLITPGRYDQDCLRDAMERRKDASLLLYYDNGNTFLEIGVPYRPQQL